MNERLLERVAFLSWKGAGNKKCFNNTNNNKPAPTRAQARETKLCTR